MYNLQQGPIEIQFEVFSFLMMLYNPLLIIVKWNLVSFEDFQILTIELHRRINMLDGKLNLNHNSKKNEKIRQMAWITNTVEDDKQKLEEMFWSTEKEQETNKMKNDAAKQWLIDKRKEE